MANPHIHIEAVKAMVDESNIITLIEGHDVVVDALDSIKTRVMVQSSA